MNGPLNRPPIIGGMTGPLHPQKYDLERDIERARLDREKRAADGILPSEEEQRLRGGMPLTDRAAVLLEHLIQSHIEAAVLPGIGEPNALLCARRTIEYVSRLEHVILSPFSVESWDDPRSLLGLAAASFESIAAVYGQAENEQLQTGAREFITLAQRLRVLEQRIAAIPGQEARTPVELPAPDIVATTPDA